MCAAAFADAVDFVDPELGEAGRQMQKLGLEGGLTTEHWLLRAQPESDA